MLGTVGGALPRVTRSEGTGVPERPSLSTGTAVQRTVSPRKAMPAGRVSLRCAGRVVPSTAQP